MVILLSKLLRDYKSSGGKFVGGEFSFKEKKCSRDTKEALLKPEECVYDAWATKPTLYNSIFSLSDILCNIKISPKPQRLNPIYEVTVYQPQNISIRNEPKLFELPSTLTLRVFVLLGRGTGLKSYSVGWTGFDEKT